MPAIRTRGQGLNLAKAAFAATSVPPSTSPSAITEAFTKWVSQSALPGAVALITLDGEVVHEDVIGFQNVADRVPIRRDTIFRISSMSKPITCLATLILVSEGKFDMDEPISKWLPELGNPRVLIDPAGPLENSRLATRPITIRHLLLHRSGLAYPFSAKPGALEGRLGRMFIGLQNTFGQPQPPDRWLSELGSIPLKFEPGSSVDYGMSMDVLGCLVTRAAGIPFEHFLVKRIFEPFEMVDTGFVLPPRKMSRLAVGYAYYEAFRTNVVIDDPKTSIIGKPLIFPSGGGGLVSTIDDYMRFCRALLGFGKIDGNQCVPRSAVEQLLQPASEYTTSFVPELTPNYGGGGGMVGTPSDAFPLPTGSLIMNGAAGVGAYVIPQMNLCAVYMTQVMGDAAQVQANFPAVLTRDLSLFSAV